jgi:hypothetical protein
MKKAIGILASLVLFGTLALAGDGAYLQVLSARQTNGWTTPTLIWTNGAIAAVKVNGVWLSGNGLTNATLKATNCRGANTNQIPATALGSSVYYSAANVLLIEPKATISAACAVSTNSLGITNGLGTNTLYMTLFVSVP